MFSYGQSISEIIFYFQTRSHVCINIHISLLKIADTDVSIKENYVLELSLGETISSGRTLASKSAPVNNLNSND